jgi:hypothetical protein
MSSSAPVSRAAPAWIAGGALCFSLAGWMGWRGDGRSDELGELRARVEALELERAVLRERLRVCEAELSQEQQRRLAREEEWLAYTRAIALLGPPALIERLPAFGPQVPATELVDPDAPREPTAAEHAQAQRDELMRVKLRTLLAAEGVRGLDLLTLEGVGADRAGPALFRLLDGSGRLSGSLFAARVRLEGSIAGRTMALVLEDGYESHGGERTLFGSADEPEGPAPWRLTLRDIDLRPWLEELAPLFGDAPPELPPDDGRWDLAYVTIKLNELLRQDIDSGWFRMRRCGGIEAGVLRDVHFEISTPDGALERRIFADRLRIQPTSEAVILDFEDGVHERGEERMPFQDRGYRVYLPRARAAEWKAAGLPGCVDEPSGPAAAQNARRTEGLR